MSDRREPPPQGRRPSMAPTQRRPSEVGVPGRTSDTQRSLGRRRHERDQSQSAPRREASPTAQDIPRGRRMTLPQFVEATLERRPTLIADAPRVAHRRSEVMRPSPSEAIQLQASRSVSNRRSTPDSRISEKKSMDKKSSKSIESKPSDNRPSDQRPPDKKLTEAKSSDVRPPVTKPLEEKKSDARPQEKKPSEVKSSDVRFPILKPLGDTRQQEKKPPEIKSSDVRPPVTKPLEEKKSDARPHEKKPPEIKSSDVRFPILKPLGETRPQEKKPPEVKSSDVGPPIPKPLEEKSSDTKTREKTTSEVKPPEKIPSDTRSEELMPPDKRSSDSRPPYTRSSEGGSSEIKIEKRPSDGRPTGAESAEVKSRDTSPIDSRRDKKPSEGKLRGVRHKGKRSSRSKSLEPTSSDAAPSDAKPIAAIPLENDASGSSAQTSQRSDLPLIESSSDASAHVVREKQVSIAPNPPEPSSASSPPTSSDQPSEFLLNTPLQPAALNTQASDESPATPRPSTLPRAPKRRRSEDIAVVIPPPVPEFRRPSEDTNRKSFPRRTSLLSRQARRASGGPQVAPAQPEAQEPPSERRSSLTERLRTLKTTASPPAREQMAVRPLYDEDDERHRRSSSIVESHYGLDQPLSAGHAVFTGVMVTALVVAYGFKLDLPNALDRMTDHDGAMGLNSRAGVLLARKMGICPDRGSSMYPKDGPFHWKGDTHRMLMRAFHLGYMFSGIPGAVLAEKTSAKWVIVSGGCCLLLSALFFPIISVFNARFSAEVFVFLLLLHGAGAGVMLPAITTLLSKWTTRRHRSVYAGIVYGGMWLGPVFAGLVDAIAENTRWQFVYHYMVLGLIPWMLIVAFWLEDDTSHRDRCVPLRDHMIVVAEQANVRSYDITLSFPFTEIAKCVHFWALLLIHFTGNLAFLTVNYLMPFYMRRILRYNVNESLVMAVVPYLAMFFVSMTAGLAIDVARHHGVISTTSGRRFAALISVIIPTVCIACITFIECNTNIASATYLVAICGLGAQTVGWFANHLDLAPNFAGPLMAITNTAATIPYVFWPTLSALTTEGFPEEILRERWGMIFQGVAGIYLISFIFYVIGGSGVLQSWNAGRKIT